jgi:hypothetical protein
VHIDLDDRDIDRIAERVSECLRPLILKDQEEDELLTVEETAAFLKVDTGWIYKHMDELPVIRVGKYQKEGKG